MRIIITAYYYLDEKMGGAEYQAWFIAQGLAARGHDVTFLTTNSDKEATFRNSNVTIIKVPGYERVGWQRHRQLLTAAVEQVEPDVCYVRSFWNLATLSAICKRAGVPVVSISCHAMEASPVRVGEHPVQTLRMLLSSQGRLHMQSFLAIHTSARHVCITRTLQHTVERWFPHRLIQTIYNGQPVPPAEDIHQGSAGQVIWVNNLKRWKRPEIFVQLAHRLPDYRFVMIGGRAEGRFGQMMQRAFEQAPANFTYLGSQPIDTVNDLIRQSDLLLYTSLPSEGFGNSFLQAWFREVPTVSLSFDPDGIIEREQVGRCSRTFEQLVTDVRELMQHEPLRREMGRRARAYAIENHSLSTLIAAYEQLFYAVVQQRDIAQEIVI